jgi:CubicO group peptidase (beta-lactamase class C family)
MLMRRQHELPAPNDYFRPPADAGTAAEFSGVLHIARSAMETRPRLEGPRIEGRDARLFPRIALGFVTLGDVLAPLQRGQIVPEQRPGRTASDAASYWSVIAQFGRVWRDPDEQEGWSRAAFPLMLVGDTENHSHQGMATFRYKGREVGELELQFVQQTAPYLLRQHFIAWGRARMKLTPLAAREAAAQRDSARAELARRLPQRPWADLIRQAPANSLDGFGGPVREQWRVLAAVVRDGTIYHQESPTPCGNYAYPLEMRFGVRSVMKSIGAPLALLRLAQVCGPYVLTLKIGDFVAGLDPKYRAVRFIDAANMATGFGGTGTWKTQPNDPMDGYLEGDYDAWYNAPSHREKLRQIRRSLRPYPWEPGTVMRYRDQDFYLLGAALDRFVKAMRGPGADVWDMLRNEVLEPVGIAHAPVVRTREAKGRVGIPWLNAGYYPTLDDLAKIGLLYQSRGAHGGEQILHRGLTEDLLAAREALPKRGDVSLRVTGGAGANAEEGELYKMGFHFRPYVGARGKRYYLPTMWGAGESEVILYPNGLVSIVIAKALQLPPGETAASDAGPETVRAVESLQPFD